MNANSKGTRAKRHAPAHARPRGLRLCRSYTRARKWVLGCSELRATLVSVLRARARRKPRELLSNWEILPRQRDGAVIPV